MMKEDIKRILQNYKKTLENKYGIKKLGFFGSFSRDEATEKSDIDIYIEFDMEKIDLYKYLSLIDELESLFGKRVDIITKDGKNAIRLPSVRENIEKEITYV